MNTIDANAEVVPPTPEPVQQSLAVREPPSDEVIKAVIAHQNAGHAPLLVTAAQAKVEAVAQLTMDAYKRASQLALTDQEIAALTAEFPDEAFKPGAGGKEHLIYIEHAYLRDRLNAVFRPGQWAIVPRNRWAEPFSTKTGTEGSRVYVEAMLCIRGCFAAEAVGEMEYYPSNASQNYGDAVEGAKTAALRRCCKEIGIGLQAWKKDWCEAWWARRRGQKPPGRAGAVSTPVQPPKAAPAPKPATQAPVKTPASEPKAATEATRQWMIASFQDDHEKLTEYFTAVGQLLPTEGLADLPLRFVPVSHEQLAMLRTRVAQFGNGERAEPAFEPNPEPPAGKAAKKAGDVAKAVTQSPETVATAAKSINVPRDANPDPNSPDAPWRIFPTPFGKHAGVALANLDKKILFGFWANFEPTETWVDSQGVERDTAPDKLIRDGKFREMLDEAGRYYGFEKS